MKAVSALPCSLQHYSQQSRYGNNLSVHLWTNKDVIYIHTQTHTHNYYSAMKKMKTVPSVTTWMDLEGIMLSEIINTEKETYCMISPICGI